MKMKKIYLITLIVVVLVIAWLFVRFIIGGNEDSWIKDSRGIWIKHGNPSETPDYVSEQQEVISDALNLYEQKKAEEMEFSSQCLGTIEDDVKYVVDIVHVPRNSEDNKQENQCEDYRNGKVSHFIELDKDGSIVRIV